MPTLGITLFTLISSIQNEVTFLFLSTRTPYLVRKALDHSGDTAGNEHFERMQDELALHRFVAWQSEWQAKREKWQPDCTWGTHISRRGCHEQVEADGAHAYLFDNACDQSHGLITKWSDRNEDRSVHPFCTQA